MTVTAEPATETATTPAAEPRSTSTATGKCRWSGHKRR
jgi:hypothetical protein